MSKADLERQPKKMVPNTVKQFKLVTAMSKNRQNHNRKVETKVEHSTRSTWRVQTSAKALQFFPIIKFHKYVLFTQSFNPSSPESLTMKPSSGSFVLDLFSITVKDHQICWHTTEGAKLQLQSAARSCLEFHCLEGTRIFLQNVMACPPAHFRHLQRLSSNPSITF